MRRGVQITGVPQIVKALDNLDQKARVKIVRQAARVTMKPVLKGAKGRAAQFEHPTGDVRESLKLSVRVFDKHTISAAVVAGKRKRSKRQLTQVASGKRRLRKRYNAAYFGAYIDAYYAHMVEYGHEMSGCYARREVGVGSIRKARKRGLAAVVEAAAGHEVPPHPFIRPAWDAIGDRRLAEDFRDRVLADLEKTWEGKP